MNMVAQIARYSLACLVTGFSYGALAGATYGAAFAGFDGGVSAIIAGAMFGFVFGAIGGAVFGFIGACLRSPAGWGFGGVVGGLVSASIVSLGAWNLIDIYDIAPGLILGTLGGVLGLAIKYEWKRVPLSRWLRNLSPAPMHAAGFLVLSVLGLLTSAYILNQLFPRPVKIAHPFFHPTFDTSND